MAVLTGRGERVSADQFPDQRENTGNFLQEAPSPRSNPLDTEVVWDEFPAYGTGNYLPHTAIRVAGTAKASLRDAGEVPKSATGQLADVPAA